jgi:hypothetical protein
MEGPVQQEGAEAPKSSPPAPELATSRNSSGGSIQTLTLGSSSTLPVPSEPEVSLDISRGSSSGAKEAGLTPVPSAVQLHPISTSTPTRSFGGGPPPLHGQLHSVHHHHGLSHSDVLARKDSTSDSSAGQQPSQLLTIRTPRSTPRGPLDKKGSRPSSRSNSITAPPPMSLSEGILSSISAVMADPGGPVTAPLPTSVITTTAAPLAESGAEPFASAIKISEAAAVRAGSPSVRQRLATTDDGPADVGAADSGHSGLVLLDSRASSGRGDFTCTSTSSSGTWTDGTTSASGALTGGATSSSTPAAGAGERIKKKRKHKHGSSRHEKGHTEGSSGDEDESSYPTTTPGGGEATTRSEDAASGIDRTPYSVASGEQTWASGSPGIPGLSSTRYPYPHPSTAMPAPSPLSPRGSSGRSSSSGNKRPHSLSADAGQSIGLAAHSSSSAGPAGSSQAAPLSSHSHHSSAHRGGGAGGAAAMRGKGSSPALTTVQQVHSADASGLRTRLAKLALQGGQVLSFNLLSANNGGPTSPVHAGAHTPGISSSGGAGAAALTAGSLGGGEDLFGSSLFGGGGSASAAPSGGSTGSTSAGSSTGLRLGLSLAPPHSSSSSSSSSASGPLLHSAPGRMVSMESSLSASSYSTESPAVVASKPSAARMGRTRETKKSHAGGKGKSTTTTTSTDGPSSSSTSTSAAATPLPAGVGKWDAPAPSSPSAESSSSSASSSSSSGSSTPYTSSSSSGSSGTSSSSSSSASSSRASSASSSRLTSRSSSKGTSVTRRTTSASDCDTTTVGTPYSTDPTPKAGAGSSDASPVPVIAGPRVPSIKASQGTPAVAAAEKPVLSARGAMAALATTVDPSLIPSGPSSTGPKLASIRRSSTGSGTGTGGGGAAGGAGSAGSSPLPSGLYLQEASLAGAASRISSVAASQHTILGLPSEQSRLNAECSGQSEYAGIASDSAHQQHPLLFERESTASPPAGNGSSTTAAPFAGAERK